jgi:hypothetical protein
MDTLMIYTDYTTRKPNTKSRLPNLLTKYAPRGIRKQDRPLKRLLDEWDRKEASNGLFP